MEPPRYHHLSLVLSHRSRLTSDSGTASFKPWSLVKLMGFLPEISLRNCSYVQNHAGSDLYSLIELLRHQSCLLFFGALLQERVWVISIARLRTSLPLHLRPINVLVLNDPYMEILS